MQLHRKVAVAVFGTAVLFSIPEGKRPNFFWCYVRDMPAVPLPEGRLACAPDVNRAAKRAREAFTPF